MKLFWLLLVVCLLSQSISLAQQTENAQPSQPQVIDESPLQELGTNYHNSIKLLQNRFRIDYKVDEITMVFFRRFGSAPVVLVRPDGSKIFQSQAEDQGIFWYDDASYDMINIKQPVPGPWQAVGQILPGSRVMVLSDIQLHSESLPEVIFSGEILKQTAYLTNGGQPINYAEFRDVVDINIQFASTNNPDAANFGAEEQQIAVFKDDGLGLDETPLDGTFTGQFNLTVPPGEWRPILTVSTPMLSRQQVDPDLILHPNPILINVELDGGGGGYHKLKIDAQREHVDMNTLLIDGKIRFPNGDIQNFSITEQNPNVREHLIVNYEYGVFRVKLTAYGNTVSGRDFILDVPEYTFSSLEPEPTIEETAAAELAESQINEVAEEAVAIVEEPIVIEEQGMSSALLWGLIIGINSCLVIAGGIVIWFLLRDKKPKLEEPGQEATAEAQAKPSIAKRLLGAVTGIFTRKSKKDAADDAIDLST